MRHIRQGLAQFAKEYGPSGLAIVGINANDAASYPEDSPEKMAAEKAKVGYTFPYLFDETQEVAKAYRAACTPDFFLFDAQRRLVYRGQFDDSRPENGKPVSGADLRAAADAVLAARPVPADQKPSIGCNQLELALRSSSWSQSSVRLSIALIFKHAWQRAAAITQFSTSPRLGSAQAPGKTVSGMTGSEAHLLPTFCTSWLSVFVILSFQLRIPVRTVSSADALSTDSSLMACFFALLISLRTVFSSLPACLSI